MGSTILKTNGFSIKCNKCGSESYREESLTFSEAKKGLEKTNEWIRS